MPTGSDVIQRTDEKPAFSDDLLGQVMQPENIQTAWLRVRANKGAAGIDGMTIDVFPDWVKSGGWKRVVNELEMGCYYPFPVRRVEIDKPDGGKRPLGIPTVVDRIIQQAIAQVLTPLFDPHFSNNSFGFRPNRNGQQAVKQVQSIIKTGRRFAVDVDLSRFFDRVNHDLLMTYLGDKVNDPRLLKLIKRAGERVLGSISRFLQNRLKLVVNTTKSHVVKTGESQFLGFTFKGGRLHWHRKTLQKFKQRIRQLTNRNWGVSMNYQLFRISQYLRGWIQYFGIANSYQRCVEPDHWMVIEIYQSSSRAVERMASRWKTIYQRLPPTCCHSIAALTPASSRALIL